MHCRKAGKQSTHVPVLRLGWIRLAFLNGKAHLIDEAKARARASWLSSCLMVLAPALALLEGRAALHPDGEPTRGGQGGTRHYLLASRLGGFNGLKEPPLTTGPNRTPGDDASRFKLLFMHTPDVENICGRVTFVSNPARRLHQKSGTSMDHTYATAPQTDGSWMAYGMYVSGGDNHVSKPASAYISCTARTTNGYTFFDTRHRPWDEGAGPFLHQNKDGQPSPMLQQALAYNNRANEVLLLYYELYNPSGNGFALNAFKSTDGLKYTAVSRTPVAYGQDALHVMWDPKSSDYLLYQVNFQPWAKKYPDNAQQGRRVITIRRSHDGATWNPDWKGWTLGPDFPKEMTLTPDANDPADLEFYWFSAFPYEDRYVGIVSLYEPCPPRVNPRNPNKPNTHGPYLGYEWWLSEDAIHWKRPYQTQYLGLEPGDTSVFEQGVFLAPPGSPIIANGEILFDGAWGVKEDRIAGAVAGPNAEFCTHRFIMPAAPLFLNATARWVGQKESLFLQRQAYIMVELIDGEGRTIPGYEKENCVFGDVDASDLPLVWAGTKGTELAGKTVQLRFYFRNARIYAVTAR
jgi:hypothetical protein